MLIITTDKLNTFDKENEESRCYNKVVTDIQKEIANLEYWKEYVEFEGKCYGIPKHTS